MRRLGEWKASKRPETCTLGKLHDQCEFLESQKVSEKGHLEPNDKKKEDKSRKQKVKKKRLAAPKEEENLFPHKLENNFRV